MKADKIQVKQHKYVPERTCVACRHTTAKRDLIRLICSDGVVEVDINGKKNGRGVYLCPRKECWDAGLKGNRIEHGLRTILSPIAKQSLSEYARNLLQKEESR